MPINKSLTSAEEQRAEASATTVECYSEPEWIQICTDKSGTGVNTNTDTGVFSSLFQLPTGINTTIFDGRLLV